MLETYQLRKHSLTKDTVHTEPSFMFSDWGMMLSTLANEDPSALLFFQSPHLNIWWSPVTNFVYTVTTVRS